MSFRRRRAADDGALPRGVRPSPQSGRPVTSAGLRGVDAALGGGLALGALTVVLQDDVSSFFVALAAYVVAQGVVCSHSVLVASMDASAPRVMAALPALASDVSRADHASAPAASRALDLRIAWRYGAERAAGVHASRVDGAPFVSDFDLAHRAVVPPSAHVQQLTRQTSPLRLLSAIQSHMQEARSQRRLVRVVLTGASDAYVAKHDGELSFSDMLARLRALARLYGAVVVVMCNANVSARVAGVLSDACLKIDSFGGRGASIAGLGSEWMGVVMVNKAYREGRCAAFRGVGDVWVFKRGRRKYTMERATAAPDDEQVAADHTKPASSTTVCSSNPSDSSLQF